MAMVSCRPRAAASAAARVASARSPPVSMTTWYARTAGLSASTIVLSPSAAAPNCWMPAKAACRAAPSCIAETSTSSPRVFAACRNPVPYNGPEAPPVFAMSARPTAVSTAAGVGGSVSSSIDTAAWKPRRRLMPWSASPMAASRWVRWSALSTTNWAASRIQARNVLASIVFPCVLCPRCQLAVVGQRPQRSAGVSTGASQNSVSCGVSRHTVIEQPAISRLVM